VQWRRLPGLPGVLLRVLAACGARGTWWKKLAPKWSKNHFVAFKKSIKVKKMLLYEIFPGRTHVADFEGSVEI
jgi:hypothetical protein